MVSKKTQEIAFNKLRQMAKDNTIYFTYYEPPYYGVGCGRDRSVDWNGPLLFYKKGESREDILLRTMCCLLDADFPRFLKQKENERKLVHLLLEAGLNPNMERSEKSIFLLFVEKGRVAPALEIAQHPDFRFPKGEEGAVFDKLSFNLSSSRWHHPCYNWINIEQDSLPDWAKDRKKRLQEKLPEAMKYHRIWQEETKDLAFLLFQKGLYPSNERCFEKLAPVVLEKDPDFFNKKKKQVISQIQHAKTPIQIYNALMGKRKEKN